MYLCAGPEDLFGVPEVRVSADQILLLSYCTSPVREHMQSRVLKASKQNLKCIGRPTANHLSAHESSSPKILYRPALQGPGP